MSYELSRGRLEAARRVLLRAIHTCPGAKALWLDGLHFLAEQVKAQYMPAFFPSFIDVPVFLHAGAIGIQKLFVVRPRQL